MRIVLDTNVVLSALLWRGTPYRLFQTIRRQEHAQLFTSAALLTELGNVLIRPVPTKRLALLGRVAREVLADYIDAVELGDHHLLAPGSHQNIRIVTPAEASKIIAP